jgi:protein-disulfide isomerase
MGVQGTPGFIIGTTLIPGAVGYAQFKAAIDAQL